MRSFVFSLFLLLSGFLSGLLGVPCTAVAQAGVVRPVLSAPPSQAAPQAASAPATVAPATNAPPAAPDITPAYLIGPEDTLQVTVWKEPSLTGNLTVRPDGMISLPLLGDVPAGGLTPMMLSANLTERLKKYITEPNVTVTVLTVNSKRVFLVGEIQRVGPLPLSPGLTVIQAIASAGGLTPFANTKRLYILRKIADKQEKIPFNYRKALKDGDLQGLELQPGDTIVAP